MILFSDGASRGNPGPAGIGVHITDEGGHTFHEIARGIGVATNNIAEYSALVAGLEWCAAQGIAEVLVRADSHLLVEQMNGRYRVKSANLKPLYAEARALARGFRRIAYEHIRREYNKEADRLANEGIDAWLAQGGDDAASPASNPSLFG